MTSMVNQPVDKDIDKNLDILKGKLGVDVTYDVLVRDFSIGNRKAALMWIDGFLKDEIISRVMTALMKMRREDTVPNPIEKIMKTALNYTEVELVASLDDAMEKVMAGPAILMIDGEVQIIVLDTRTYPARGPQEPDLERVIRGSRDGFIETMVFNTALIRRRLRDPNLRFEMLSVGARSKTDVVIAYIDDIVNHDMVDRIRSRINDINVDGIPMAEKTIEEYIVDKNLWWNPYPTVRFSERPDVTAVHLLEGHVVVIVDGSPSAMILPATLFHHLQHAEEFREDVLVGTWFRWVRYVAVLFSWLGTPLWLALALSPEVLPPALQFIGPRETGAVPLVIQFLIADVAIDILRIAMIHTPTALATALGFIGAILLGQIAVETGLFINETILFTVAAALGSFATPSFEFGMATRLWRLVLLVLVGLFRLPGLLAGVAANIVFVALMKSFGVPYLWPLIPLDRKALSSVLIRRPLPIRSFRASILKPGDPDRAPKKEK